MHRTLRLGRPESSLKTELNTCVLYFLLNHLVTSNLAMQVNLYIAGWFDPYIQQ